MWSNYQQLHVQQELYCTLHGVLMCRKAVCFAYLRSAASIWRRRMTDKELKRLSRSELLEMLIAQMKENEALQSRLELAEAQLNDRQIAMEKAGTLAEASLSLNGVFEAAEAAAQQYLENIERMSGQQETICRDMQAEAEAKAAEIVREAQEYSKKTHAEADAYWKQIVARARALLKERDALRELIQAVGRNEEK